MTNTMLAAMIGGWEILLILAVIGFPAVVAAIVLAIYLASRKKKSTVAAPPPIPSSTVRLPRKCPQCHSELKADLPEGLCPACLLQHGIATEAGPQSGQPFTPPTLAELSKLFPQLEILGPIGKGGMGAVYKARQPVLDRIVALKILAPKPGNELDFASRFSREARALARLNHPNIVAVYDFGVVSGLRPEDTQSGHRPDATPASLSYFIMEYVDGPNLRQVQQAGRLAPREALEIIPQICAALQFAHDEGIVHRDIKPENVLLDKKGRVKIADFGLAKILGQEPKDFRLTGEKDVMGTPHYMAPEQIEKPQEVDHRADIYSLGVVFYEMLTGELPLGKFQAPSQKVQVDVRLDDVVLRALEKEPQRRYQHASEFKTRVETIGNTTHGDSELRESVAKPEKASSRLRSVTLTIINVLLALLLGAIGWGAFHVGAFFNVLFIFILCAVPTYVVLILWRLFRGTLEYRLWRKPFDREMRKYWLVILNRWVFWLLAAWVLKLCIVPPQFAPSVYSMIRGFVWGGVAAVMLLELLPGKRIYAATNMAFSAGSMFMAFQIAKIYTPNRVNEAVLAFPVRGEWLVVHGGNSLLINNHYQLQSQRNALDVERLVDGLETTDDRGTLESYPSWGEAVYSPVEGRIVSVVDDLPDNTIGKSDRRNPAGNHLLIDTGRDYGRYILLAHLQRKSIQVRTGDMVKENQFLARCGNSGNTSHPHLHIQVQDRPDLSVANVKTFPILFYNASANRSKKLPIPADLRRNDRIVSDQPWVDISATAEPAESDSSTLETWSPALVDDQKPDLSRIRQEAEELLNTEHYEDALQRILWLFNHALEYDKGFKGIRVSFLLSDWIELGRRYPKARQTLLEIRDRDTKELSEGRGYSDLFADVVAINQELQNEEATYRLFKSIRDNDPALARQCYFWIEDLLVKKGEYEICAEYMGNPKQRFDSIRRSFNMEMESAQRTSDFWKRTQQMNEQNGRTNLLSLPDSSEMMRSSAQDRFIKGTRQLIEILVATDRLDEANAIGRAALATLPDKRIETGIADACVKLGKIMPPVVARATTGTTNRLQFRWVARDSEINLPADLLNDPRDRAGQGKLRVLRDVLMDETAISSAGFATYQPDQKEILVLLTDAGRRFFSAITETNINRQLAIVWNGRILSAPIIRSAITGPSLNINGMFSDVEAETLLSVLNRREPHIVSNVSQSVTTNPPNSSQVSSPLDIRVRDINSRLEAAKSIMMFTERDAALVSIAKDAAATGNVELTKKAVMQITAFTTRDDAARAAARTLAANGHRAEALEIARTITAFTTRDETLRELAGK